MDKYKLKQIIKRGEGPKVDFKLDLKLLTDGEKKEFTKDVIAIANSRGGRGYLIFGVEDKTKRIVGINEESYGEEKIQQIIYHRCDPPVPISIDFVDIDGKKLAIITIYKSNHKPHQMLRNGAFYLRRGSTTDIARRSDLADMLQHNGFLTYETVIMKNSNLNDLDYKLIKEYFKNLNVYSDKPSEHLLAAIGVIGKETEKTSFKPTIGGVLLFGKNPTIFMPHSHVKVNYENVEKTFSGSIISILNDITNFLEKNLNNVIYPIDLIIELVANALVHRDYMDFSSGVGLRINDKKVEITNPGALYSTNNIYKVLRIRTPKRRNSWLYQRLLIQDDKKRFLNTQMSISKINGRNKYFNDLKFINIGSHNLFKVRLNIIKK